MENKIFSLRSLLNSFRYAINGIKEASRTEWNVQIHVFIAIVIIVLGYIVNLERWEWVSIILCVALVIAMELINSSIEKLVDILIPEYNVKAGLVKDIAAGSVLVCSIAAAIVGCIIFVPKFL
jgi:diacylglycerol kinase